MHIDFKFPTFSTVLWSYVLRFYDVRQYKKYLCFVKICKCFYFQFSLGLKTPDLSNNYVCSPLISSKSDFVPNKNYMFDIRISLTISYLYPKCSLIIKLSPKFLYNYFKYGISWMFFFISPLISLCKDYYIP